MTETLPWEHLYPVFLALFARIAAFLQTAPLTGERQVPPKVRVGVAALVAIAFVGLHPAVSMESLFYVLPGEVLLGLVAGFTARVVIAGVETGGELIGLQMGLGFASTFDPTLGDTALPMRRLAFLLAAMAFVTAGGIEAPAHLAALPTVEVLTLVDAFHSLFARGAEMIVIGVRIATPILVAVTVANVAVGIANRAAPALNVFSVMLTLTGILGALVLLATAPRLATELSITARRAVAAALGQL